MSDLTDFLDQSPSPAVASSGPTPPATSAVGEDNPILNLYHNEPSAKPLAYAVDQGRQIPPDHAAQILATQAKTGLPADLIERNPDIKPKDFDAAQYQQDHPVVSKWLQENPNHAAVAQNDLENLGYMERQFGTLKTAYRQTQLSNERSDLATSAMMGNATPEQMRRIDQIDQEMAGMPNYGLKGVSKIPGLMVDFALSQATRTGIKGGLAFGAGGAVAGSAVGGVGAVPGAIGGFGEGMTAGFAVQSARDAAANMYLSRIKAGDDRKTALALALPVGAINGALMTAPMAKMTGISPGLDWLSNLGVNKVLESPTIRNAIARYGVNMVETSGVMGAMNAMASLVNSIGSDIGDLHKSGDLAKMSPGALLSTFLRDESLQKAKVSAGEGALTGLGMGGITGLMGLHSDLKAVRDAQARSEAFKTIGETIKNSEVYQKAPAKTQEIIQRLTRDGPLENGFIPMEAWQTYWQGKNVDPRDAAESVMGDAKAYDHAMQTGSDLQIPMDKYAVTLAPTEHNTYFQDEIRTHPNEMNAREAKEFLKTEMESAKKGAEPGPVEQAAGRIRDDIEKQLTTAGYGSETARNYAKVYESAFGSMGQRSGIDPYELYQRYGLNIQKLETDLPSDSEAVKARAEEMSKTDQTKFEADRAQFDQWKELLKAGIKPSADVAEEHGQIPNWMKKAEGRGADEVAQEAREKGLLGPNEDIYQKLKDLKAPEKPRASRSYMEAAARELGQDRPKQKQTFLQAAMGKVKTLFQGSFKYRGEEPTFEKLQPTEISDMEKKAIEHFGITDNPKEAGYILSDGTMLDLSGKNRGGRGGTRELDHLEAGHALTDEQLKSKGHASGKEFFMAQTNAVRFSPNGDDWMAQTKTVPSDQQVRAIQEAVNKEQPKSIYLEVGQRNEHIDNPTSEDVARFYRGTSEFYQSAFHGTPHDVDKFSLQKIGTGQGAQTYGWGLYFAGKKEVADNYREQLAGKMNVQDFHIGDFHAMKLDKEGNEQWSDYSPKTGSTYDNTRAAMIENILIDQAGVEAAFAVGGEKAAKAHVLQMIDDQIKDYRTEYPEGAVELAKWRKIVEKQGVKIKAEKPGNVYEVDIPGDEKYLHWELPLSKQPEEVKDALEKIQVGDHGQNILQIFKNDADEMTGEDIYKKIVDDSANIKATEERPVTNEERASKRLNEAGIPGLRYLDAGSRPNTSSLDDVQKAYKDGSTNYVLFDDKLVNILNRYKQGSKDGPRGFIQFGDQNVNISLLKNADLSTFLHETGHLYLNVLGDLAKTEGVTDQIKDDYAKVLDYLGAKDGVIETEHHEKFAQAFEQYLMEGKAPSLELRAPFQRFRAWLISVYRNVSQLTSLTPEVKGVFDRLLATDDEINAAQAQQDMAPLFPDPKAMGMTDAKAASYQKAIDDSRASAEQELISKQMAQIQRETKKAWVSERDSIRETMAQEVDNRPEQLARAFLYKGTFPDGSPLPEDVTAFKLSKTALKKDFPDTKLSDLRGLYTADGGVSPDEAAGPLGFKSGAELLNALKGTQDRDTLLDQMADAKMKELHGDLMNRPELAEAAMKAVHNKDRAQVLQKELEHLASDNLPALKGMIRQMTRRIPRLEEVTAQAEQTIDESLGRNIYPSLYERAESRESRLAGEALTKGDIHGAFEAKQRELLNHELYTAATNAIESREKALDYFAKFDKETYRDRIAQGGRDGGTYLEQIDSLLNRFDIRKSVSLKELSERKDLATWAQEQRVDNGYDIGIPDKFINDAYSTHWKDMPHGDLMDLYSTVRNIAHLARDQAEILIDGEKVAFGKLKADLASSIRENHTITDKEPPTLTKDMKDRLITGTKQYATEHFRPEFMFSMLDGWKENGPYWRTFFKQYKDAENNELTWRRQSMESVKDIINEAYTPSERRELFDRMETPEVNNRTISKMNLLMMAANHGNRYNLEGMNLGVKDWANAGQIQKLLENHLTLKDWETVQALADHVNSYWPRISEMEKRVNGIAPKKVNGDPISFKTADGQVFKSEGWYWPIKFDPEQDIAAQKTQNKEAVEDMFGGSYARSQTQQGHLQARTWTAGRPFLLDSSVLTDHLSNMIHDLAFREYVINTNKLLNDSDIRNDMSSVLGKEGYEEMAPWLRRIAGEKMGNPISKAEGLIGTARSNITTASLGLRIPVALKHLISYGAAVRELGTEYASKGFSDAWAKPWQIKDQYDFIAERSPMMAERQMFLDRDLRDYWKGYEGLTPYDAKIQKSFTMFLNGFDLATSIPTWLGAYRKGMEGASEVIESGNEKDSIAYADSVVRMTKGAASPGDLPSVMVGSPAYKLWTMFYNPMNLAINNVNKVRGEFVMDHNVPKVIAGAALTWFLPALLHDRISRGISNEDKEHPFKSMAKDIALFPMEGVVLGRNVAQAVKAYRGSSDDPFSEFLASTGKTVKALGERTFGDKEEMSRQDINAMIDTAGGLTGIPTRQIWQTTEYLYDYLTGEERPDSVLELMRNVALGKKAGS